MTDQSAANRAEHAQRLLDDTLLREALDAIRKEVVTAWVECPQANKDEKEAFWQLMKTANKFENMLLGYVQLGRLSKEQQSNLARFEPRRGLSRLVG